MSARYTFLSCTEVSSIHDFFNRYNLASMCLELENLAGIISLSSSEDLVFEASENVFDDLHYTPAAVSECMETIQERRRYLHKQLSNALAEADVVVITLGLCEAWYDTRSQKYLNVVSSPQMLRKNGEHLELRSLEYRENASFLERIVSLLQKMGSKKIICTVSPVPLEVTYSGGDIVLANYIAKSILRVVAEEVCKKHDNVDYFPSFEIAMLSDRNVVWKPDGRHVQEGLVNYIISTALGMYLEEGEKT